jgi:uncharacterized protein
MRTRATASLLGVAFGFLLAWGQFSSPHRIRQMLLLEDGYLWIMFAVAVAFAFVGLRVLSAVRARSPLTGELLRVSVTRPERRHVVGSLLFGGGWAVSDSCPGPIAVQLGQGVLWSVFTILGVGIGISLYFRRQRAKAPEAETALVD